MDCVLTRISISPLQKNLSESYQSRVDFAQFGVSVLVTAKSDQIYPHPEATRLPAAV
jgi:hypothetical protein